MSGGPVTAIGTLLCILLVTIIANAILDRVRGVVVDSDVRKYRELFFKYDIAFAAIVRRCASPAPKEIDWLNVSLDRTRDWQQLEVLVKDYGRQLSTLSVWGDLDGLCWHQLYLHCVDKQQGLHGSLFTGQYSEAEVTESVYFTPEAVAGLISLLTEINPKIKLAVQQAKNNRNS